MKLSACRNITLSMIGQDRLNIGLKESTGGSQPNPDPLQNNKTLLRSESKPGVNTSNLHQPASYQEPVSLK